MPAGYLFVRPMARFVRRGSSHRAVIDTVRQRRHATPRSRTGRIQVVDYSHRHTATRQGLSLGPVHSLGDQRRSCDEDHERAARGLRGRGGRRGGGHSRTAQQMIKKTSRLRVSTALHSLSAAEKSVPRGSQRSWRRTSRPSTDRTCHPRKSEKRGKDHWHLLLE